GLVKVWVNCSSVSRAFDLKVLSSLTMVCGISSRFVQRTVVPTGTVTVAGEKLKLSILTAVSDADWASAGAAKVLELLPIPSTIARIAIPKIQNLFFILFPP